MDQWPKQVDKNYFGLGPRNFWSAPHGTENLDPSPLSEQQKIEISKMYGPEFVTAAEIMQDLIKNNMEFGASMIHETKRRVGIDLDEDRLIEVYYDFVK